MHVDVHLVGAGGQAKEVVGELNACARRARSWNRKRLRSIGRIVGHLAVASPNSYAPSPIDTSPGHRLA
eukprot:9333769-Pyramimonas_sp.AAC.1